MVPGRSTMLDGPTHIQIWAAQNELSKFIFLRHELGVWAWIQQELEGEVGSDYDKKKYIVYIYKILKELKYYWKTLKITICPLTDR